MRQVAGAVSSAHRPPSQRTPMWKGRPDVAGFDHGVEALHRGGEAPVEARHADAPGARGRLHHVAPLGGGHGERLLAEHVGAPGEGGERDGVMQGRR